MILAPPTIYNNNHKLYSLSVFSLAYSLQLIFENSATYREVSGVSVAERLERRICNPEAPRSSLALTASWICSW